MPQGEEHFRQLTVSIRHQGHISEHSISGNYSWRNVRSRSGFFGDSSWESHGQDSFLGESNDPDYGGEPLPTDWGSELLGEWGDVVPASAHPHSFGYPCSPNEEGWVACDACGAYESGADSDTETEYEVTPTSSILMKSTSTWEI